MTAIVLALGSSLAWGVSDFLGGLKSRSVPLLMVLLVSQGAALALLSIVVLAAGEPPPGGSFLLFGAMAWISEAIGVAALYRGLAVGETSIVAPAAATAPLIPIVVGIVLGEVPGRLQGAGIALAVIGIAITVCRSDAEPTSAQALVPSLAYGLVCALGFGGFYVAMDAASEGEIPWALLVARATAVTLFAIALISTRAPFAVQRGDIAVLASIGVMVIGADAMYATASTHGILGVVAALSTLYPLVTIALARAYLHEPVSHRQWFGIATCLAGVIAVSATA